MWHWIMFYKQPINTLYWTVFQSCAVPCKTTIYGSISLCTFDDIYDRFQIIKFRNNFEAIHQLVDFNLPKGITDCKYLDVSILRFMCICLLLFIVYLPQTNKCSYQECQTPWNLSRTLDELLQYCSWLLYLLSRTLYAEQVYYDQSRDRHKNKRYHNRPQHTRYQM